MPYLFKLVKRLSINDVGLSVPGRSFFGANPSAVTNRFSKPSRRPRELCTKALACVVLLGMMACADAGDPTDPVFQSTGIVTMQLWPREPTIEVGDSIDFVAVGLTAAGDTVVVLDVTWSANGGEIHGNGKGKGRYKGRAVGRNMVKAVKDSLVDSTTVTVTPVPVAFVDVTPNSAVVEIGQALQLTAVVEDADGNPLNGRTVEWASANPDAATVGGAGLVTGVGTGFSTIRATSEGRSGTAQIMVTATVQPVATVDVIPAAPAIEVGGTVQLNATPRDAAGNALQGRLIVWSSAEEHIATVNGSGMVSAEAAGAATITATSEGQSGAAQVTVTAAGPPPVVSVDVTPATASLEVGAWIRLTATPRDAAGNALSGRVVSWATSTGAVATVNQFGRVTAQSEGSATITATSEGQSGSAQVTVTVPAPPPVASVDVTPGSLSLSEGQTSQLTATPRDAAGNALSGRAVSWATSTGAVATVNGSGMVSAEAAGAATITATSEGQSGAAQVTVTAAGPPPVVSVDVTPATASLEVGAWIRLTATPRDAAGNALSGRVVSWATSTGAVATVNQFGRVTAQSEGSATITATSEGQSGSAQVTVTVPAPPPVASVDVTPGSLSLSEGQTSQLTATPRDAAGNALSGRAVSWATSTGAVATVNGSGMVSAEAAGAATITATSEGQSGAAQVTVTDGVVVSVDVTPSNTSVFVGESVQLTATGRDASGNEVPGQTASWSSSDNSVASVNGAGLVAGNAAGTATITATINGVPGSAGVTVEERQGGGGVLFKSDWSSGSVSDGGSWTNVSNHNALVSANGLDFPAAMNNVLRQTYPSGGMQSVWVQSSAAAWSAPAVGESRYFRLYYRQDWRAGGIGGNGHHWIQANPGTCAYEWQWIIEPNGNGTFNVRYGLTLLNPGGRFGPVTLNEDTTYRFEWRLHRTASNSVKYEVRVYDPAGALVLDTDDVPGLASATGTPNVNCLRNMLIGYNGGNNISVESYQYIGAVAVCEDDWCGPYTGSN